MLSETNSGKNPIKKDRESTYYLMANHIMGSGRITKCMVMASYSSHLIESGIKGNSKMACSMDLVLSMHMNKYHKDRQKSIKHLSGSIKEVGLNIKEDSKMTKGKDLERPSLKMVFGLGTLRMASLTVMAFGKLVMGRDSKASGKMAVIDNQPEKANLENLISFKIYIFFL